MIYSDQNHYLIQNLEGNPQVHANFDKGIEKEIKSYFDKYMVRSVESFKIQNQELWDYEIETENIRCNRNDY